MADEEPDQEQLEAQMETAVDAIRGAVLRLLREGEVHPQIVVMVAARVAGGLGAGAALAIRHFASIPIPRYSSRAELGRGRNAGLSHLEPDLVPTRRNRLRAGRSALGRKAERPR